MADTEHGAGAVRTKSGELLGEFAYVLTRAGTGPAFQYDLQLSELHTAPSSVRLQGEELTLELVAGRTVRFAVRGARPDADGLRLDLVVLDAPTGAKTAE